jgi:hypothetical protein
MNDLLKEAIADAKAVRQTALANAKLALEEAFTPRIQSMLAAKLSEEMEDEMTEEEETSEYDTAEAEELGSDAAMAHAEENGEGTPVSEEEEPTEDYMDEMHGNIEDDSDLDLESIIRELEGEETEEEPVAENVDSSDIGRGENNKPSKEASDETTKDPQCTDLFEEFTLDEIVKALREEEGEEEMKEEEEPAKELEEAYNVIRFLRSKINEVNLLNAKLLFSNKLFRNYELNEGQKMRVIENFDRATTMREVKLVYTTIAESFTNRANKAKQVVKESKTTASAAQRSTAPSKKVLNEGNDLAIRWKKLANLK